MPRLTLAPLAFAAMLTLAACGSGAETGDGSAPDYSALRHAPPPLAALYSQPNRLVGTGPDDFDAQLAELEGHLVVVNDWASWCGPCRAEFPVFQEVSAKLGAQVAFFGVDNADNDDAAETFLAEYPVPYPSYRDPDETVLRHVFEAPGLPATGFYDTSGTRVYVHYGPYASKADLQADIRRYLTSSSG